MNYWLLLFIPVTTALAGWLTIRLFIKMLFHPVQQKKIFGFHLQGIYPKNRQQLAGKLGEQIRQSGLFNSLEEKINNPGNLEKIMPLVENHIDDFLRNRLSAEMPMISMFIGDKTIVKLKEAFLKEIRALFPQVMKEFAGNLEKDIDPTQLIGKYIDALTPGKLERNLRAAIPGELRLASIAGAIIGLIIGVFQVLIIYVVSASIG